MVHNEHDAFTVILFCAVTVQTIKKWEKLQNVCDVEHCQNKIFMATKMQTGSERISDTQKKSTWIMQARATKRQSGRFWQNCM